MRLVKKLKTFKNKDGKEVQTYNFFIELGENAFVCVEPVFKEDRGVLKAFAEKID